MYRRQQSEGLYKRESSQCVEVSVAVSIVKSRQVSEVIKKKFSKATRASGGRNGDSFVFSASSVRDLTVRPRSEFSGTEAGPFRSQSSCKSQSSSGKMTFGSL